MKLRRNVFLMKIWKWVNIKMKEFKCKECIYFNPDGFQLNGYDEKIPDTCKTGSEYYCVISGYSLFESK